MRTLFLLLLLLVVSTGCVSVADRREYAAANSHRLTERQISAIQRGRVVQGMTEKDVESTWGYPKRYTRYVSGSRSYLDMHYSRTTIHFRDGKVSGWTEF